ncbi:MAG: hypothetical protein QNJ58_27050 [Desulfobacterales bacterium]|nr:hypothetical protein [Desulfobacterales bacterium]
MAADQDNQQLPVKQKNPGLQVRPETALQAGIGYLPRSDSIDPDEKIQIAREEGYDPLAIEMALVSPRNTFADKIRLFILLAGAVALVVFFFPKDRFFEPSSSDLGSMRLGGPILEETLKEPGLRRKPWLKVLVDIDRLYFQEGKLSEAIRLAESALARVPHQERENWRELYYRYWELLADADRAHVLKTSTRSYLAGLPEDPFANYYFARAVLISADPSQSLGPETAAAYRQETEFAANQLDLACRTLEAQKTHPESDGEKKENLTDLYRKLRLEQARLYVLIWRLGDYEEDEHPDVVFRDKALDICEIEELADMKEARALKAQIYTRILDRWYWFEGRQIIQNQLRRKRDIRDRLDALNSELRAAEK